MKFKYKLIFIPNGVEVDNINETKEITMTSNKRFDSRDELRNKAQQEAIYQRAIDEYAIRNYWKVACCEMKLKNSPWDNIKQLSDHMRQRYDVNSIPRSRNNWRHESIECHFDSVDKRRDIQSKLSNRFHGKLPIATKNTNLRITLRAKANVSMKDFQESKKVFKAHIKSQSSG